VPASLYFPGIRHGGNPSPSKWPHVFFSIVHDLSHFESRATTAWELDFAEPLSGCSALFGPHRPSAFVSPREIRLIPVPSGILPSSRSSQICAFKTRKGPWVLGPEWAGTFTRRSHRAALPRVGPSPPPLRVANPRMKSQEAPPAGPFPSRNPRGRKHRRSTSSTGLAVGMLRTGLIIAESLPPI